MVVLTSVPATLLTALDDPIIPAADLARLPDRLTGGHLRVDTIEAEPWVATDRLWSIRSQVTTLSLEVELHYFAQIRSRTVRS